MTIRTEYLLGWNQSCSIERGFSEFHDRLFFHLLSKNVKIRAFKISVWFMSSYLA